MPRDMVTD